MNGLAQPQIESARAGVQMLSKGLKSIK
jgi:hypothetical protein